MAITLYTGVPGSGKSHELVSEIIVPAVTAGRRVVTNIDGINPEKVRHYCAIKSEKPLEELGSVVTFDGRQMDNPAFFPTADISPETTFIKGGDVLVIDEFKLYVPTRTKLKNPDLEKFFRWHRHLTDDRGRACDVAIGTQIAADVHQDFRALIETSFKLKKLKVIGRPTQYSWLKYSGHLQPKGGEDVSGLRSYNPEIFPLYKSYNADGGSELQGDKRENALNGWKAKAMIGAFPLLFIGGLGGLWWAWGRAVPAEAASPSSVVDQARIAPGQPAPAVVGAAPAVSESPWRIVGYVDGDEGMRVIVAQGSSDIRTILPGACSFDQGRPVTCQMNGQTAFAQESIPANTGSGMGSLLDGMKARAQ
jgi:zona occludens toxin